MDEQKGSVSLRLKGISIGEVASALATAARPFDRLKLAGFMDGSVETRWRGSPNAAETAITMTLTPPARLAPGQLPVTASGRGVYRSAAEELELHEFTA